MSDTFWDALGATGGTLAFGGVVFAGLTRASLEVSQPMTADAIRSRLDSQAPGVTLKPAQG
ncbi:hypothetical protein HW130_14795 [Streptomyces sp. PKU-EA00015]|uniref:hypothetical protein n=1 Tax=Streptomyces sp. PKU-EA00015 TaxID=2748326 RepID=UPI00159F814A|nr:hypothetical protein [Streptomyces sp. PKU-EA00015]NWF27516.1 hypothetical protein [Streptomyces sp. PKU-EA00015]